LTQEDPMLERIEAATHGTKERQNADSRDQSHPNEAVAYEPGPLDPGEPESARFEPDASQ
jgi:hypothetical protein